MSETPELVEAITQLVETRICMTWYPVTNRDVFKAELAALPELTALQEKVRRLEDVLGKFANNDCLTLSERGEALEALRK